MSSADSAKKLSLRLDGVSESATLKLNALVQSMRAKGEDVVNLTAGEPDFPVPDVAKAAVRDALDRNLSKYTPAAGVPELRELVAKKMNSQHPAFSSAPWVGADVVVTNGGKQSLFNLMLALLNPGDEVLIPAPYWLSYPEMAKLAGGVPKFIESDFARSYKITPDSLAAALTEKSRLLVLNSPSNPTGSVYSFEEYRALGEVLRTHPHGQGVWVVSDEIYDRILFNGHEFVSFLRACPELRERTVTVNGLSKSGAMTGWRLGWSVAPKLMTQALILLQGQSTSGISSLTQAAGCAVLKLPDSFYTEWTSIYRRRRDLALEILGTARKLKIVRPEGAFYVFVGIEAVQRPGESAEALAEALLVEGKVAVVPGTPFGAPGSLRLSFALDDRDLEKGCRRIADWVNARG